MVPEAQFKAEVSMLRVALRSPETTAKQAARARQDGSLDRYWTRRAVSPAGPSASERRRAVLRPARPERGPSQPSHLVVNIEQTSTTIANDEHRHADDDTSYRARHHRRWPLPPRLEPADYRLDVPDAELNVEVRSDKANDYF